MFNVLFLCTGNSARSILAEAILNRAGADKFKAYSAGSHPNGAVNPLALQLLKTMHYPTDDFRSKSWDEFAEADAPRMDFVFTVCGDAADEVCPLWPGHPMTAHWGVSDPARVEGSDAAKGVAFANTYRMLNGRITAFISLPLASLSNLSLQKRLNDIGNQ